MQCPRCNAVLEEGLRCSVCFPLGSDADASPAGGDGMADENSLDEQKGAGSEGEELCLETAHDVDPNGTNNFSRSGQDLSEAGSGVAATDDPLVAGPGGKESPMAGQKKIVNPGDENEVTVTGEENLAEVLKRDRDLRESRRVTHLEDLAGALPSRLLALPPINDRDIEFKRATILQNRFMIVCGFDREVNQSGAVSLANTFESAEKLWLDFELHPIEGETIEIDSVITPRESPTGEIVFLLNFTESCAFLDAILTEGDAGTSRILPALVKNRYFLICIIDLKMLPYQRNTGGDVSGLFWEINFLPPLLRHNYPRKFEEYQTKVLEQRAENRWPFDDEEFYEVVSGYARNGRLPQAITERDLEVSGEDIGRAQASRIEEMFVEDDVWFLRVTMLFVAAFFPGLSPREFKRVVGLFLGTQSVNRAICLQVGASEGPADPSFEEVLLFRIFQEKSHQLMKECSVEAVGYGEAPVTIEYNVPELRRDVRQHILTRYPLWVDSFFEIVQKQGLLFDHLSHRLVENMIQLAIDMVIIDPVNGNKWLLDMARGIYGNQAQYVLRGRENIGVAGSPGQNTSFEKIRFAVLVRRIHDTPQLADLVKRFLEALTAERLHDALLDIVSRLRSSPSFDTMHWIKRLLDQGGADIRGKAYTLLLRHFRHGQRGILSNISLLLGWLPEPGAQMNEGSPSARCARQLFFDYTLQTLADVTPVDYGQFLPQNALLAAIDQNYPTQGASIIANWSISSLFGPSTAVSADWMSSVIDAFRGIYSFSSRETLEGFLLFRSVVFPQMLQIFKVGEHRKEKRASFLFAVVLADWFLVLKSLEASAASEEGNSNLQWHSIRTAFFSGGMADRPAFLTELADWWKLIHQMLGQAIIALGRSDRSKKLYRNKQQLSLLIKDFKLKNRQSNTERKEEGTNGARTSTGCSHKES